LFRSPTDYFPLKNQTVSVRWGELAVVPGRVLKYKPEKFTPLLRWLTSIKDFSTLREF